MKGALRYLWDVYISTSLAAVGSFALISLVGSPVLKVEFFGSYYYMLPMILLIFVIIFSFNISTIFRNMALSMNCLRRHFFWGCQAAFLAVALAGTAIIWLAGVLPDLVGIGYAMQERNNPISGGMPAYIQPVQLLFLLALSLLLQPTGAALGGLYGRSKVWATVLLVIVILLGIAGTVLMLFVNAGELSLPPAVPIGLLCVLTVTGAVSEVYFWRSNAKTIVR